MDIAYITRRAKTDCGQGIAQAPAVSLEGGSTWTYQELHDRSNCYANGLLSAGAVRGDRVALLMYNSLEYLAIYFAIVKIGCVAVRLNFRLSSDELEFILSDSGSRILCLHDAFTKRVAGFVGRPQGLRYVVVPYEESHGVPDWADPIDVLAAGPASDPPVPEARSDDAAMLMYTSGTTGRPKGAIWTHEGTLWIGAMQAIFWGYDLGTVAMTTGPLYHVGGFEDLLLPSLLVGGHAVVTRSTGFNLSRVVDAVEAHRVTDLFLFPFMIYELVGREDLAGRDWSSVQSFFTGGSAILPWAVRKLKVQLPHTRLDVGYGLTEGGAISTIMSGELTEAYPDCVGRPLPLTEVRLVKSDGLTAGEGEDGEVWVRSPSVSRGYWKRPEATAETFVDGWCRTGDQGKIAGPGLLKITGRIKDMIKSGGENIYPAEVENVLAEHASIKEAAVIGVPDERFQEAVCAVVVLQPGRSLTAEQVIDYCRGRMASYKKPKHVAFVDSLPRNATGKILKYVLRDHYQHLGSTPSGGVSEARIGIDRQDQMPVP